MVFFNSTLIQSAFPGNPTDRYTNSHNVRAGNTSLAPLSHHYPNSIAYRLQTSWLQAAFSDACLFHAILFSSSAFIDIALGTRDNPVTIYHQTETVRLVQEAISKSHYDGLADSIVAATLYLAYFAVSPHFM
jgi:hypothetical protein